MLLAAVCRIGPRLEASPSKAVIRTGDRVCDGCREGGRRRPWRGRASWTDPCRFCMSTPAGSSTTVYSTVSHDGVQGLGGALVDFSMLEQCATLHLPVLDFHMIALGGSSRCNSGGCGCGGNGAIFSTCMTARHDRRAHLSHLCCGLCAIRARWTGGTESWADRLLACCFEMAWVSGAGWARACCRAGRGYLQRLAVVGSQACQALARCSR
jgi:hypothetical protein